MSTPDESRRILDGVLSENDRSDFEDIAPEHPSPEVLASYAAGGLDGASTRALDRYFDQHPERRGELDELRAFMVEPPGEETAATETAGSRKRPRRLRTAAVVLFGVCAAAGYGGGVWHGRHTWKLTVSELLEISKDPTQPYRNNTIHSLQLLQRGITNILADVADDDPTNATTPAEAKRMGMHARLRLFWQAYNAIEALEDLSHVENTVVAEDARKRLIKILSKIASADPTDAEKPRESARLRLFDRENNVIMAVVDLSRAKDPIVLGEARQLLLEIEKLTR